MATIFFAKIALFSELLTQGFAGDPKKIVSGIFGRHNDFKSGSITECYMVHNSKAVVVKPEVFAESDKNTVKRRIEEEVEKLRT